MQEELQQFVQEGADLVITKPMKPNVLFQILKMSAIRGSQSEFPKRHLIVVDDGEDCCIRWVQ